MSKRLPVGVYAKAYLRAIHDDVDGYGDLVFAEGVLRTIPTLRLFISDRTISKEDRAEALRIAFPKIHDETVGLLLLLAEHRMIKRLERITEAIRKEYEYSGVAYVHTTSVVELTEKDRTHIKEKLKGKFGTNIRLSHEIDPSVLGGLRIQCGDWTYDATIKGNIERLKRQLTL